MMKRIIALLTMAVLLLGMFSGCKKENEQGSEQVAAGLEASLVISCQAEEAVLTVLKAQLEKFQTLHTGVQVTLDTTGEADANVVCATADQLMDYMKEDKLVDMETWLNDSGLVVDAEGTPAPLGLTETQQKDFVELYWEECKQLAEKGTYMLPFYRESLVLYFNGTYFEENELENPYTWEIVEMNCQAIKEQKPEAKPFVCKDVLGLFLSLCAEYGAEYTAEDGVAGLLATDGALKAAKLLNDWYQKGYLTTEDLSLQDEGVYMVLDTSSNLQKPKGTGEAYTFELKVMNLPYPETETRLVLSTGANLAILRTDDDDQMMASWLLVKSLCADTAFQAELAMAGSFTPVLTSVEVYETYSDYLDHADGGENISALVALTCMEQQHKLYAAPVYEGSAEEKEKLAAFVVTCMESAEGVDALMETGIE